MNDLFSALKIPTQARVVAAVGSGGKTTCLKALARCAFDGGSAVVLTTTTHMARESSQILWKPGCDLEIALERNRLLFTGSADDSGKLLSLPSDVLHTLTEQADYTFIEADGSKRLPAKCLAPWEPVLPPETEHVLILFGLSAIGKPMHQVCHRFERAQRLLGCPDDAVCTPELAAELVKRSYLTRPEITERSFTVVLNQKELVTEAEVEAFQRCLAPEITAAISLNTYESI